jgi:PKHD-type hydroxylase
MTNEHEPLNLSINLPKPARADAPGGGWHFRHDFPHEWCWHKDAFTPIELDAIIRIGEAIEQHKGITGGGDNSAIRDSYVSWLFPNEITGWIFERLQGVVQAMNESFYRFDLDGFFQGLQFTKYTAPGQHYTWHVDRGVTTGVRKLSLSLQLTDPDTYEGGDLELKFGEEAQTASRDRGMICLFPSWSLHRVSPVTKGTRYSLVAWVSGPPFK